MVFLKIFGLGLWTAFAFAMGREPGGLNAFGQTMAFSFFLAAPWLYLFPTYEAWQRDRPALQSIALVNVLLGWSIVGWVIAMVWALRIPSAKADITAVESPISVRATKTCPHCAEDVLAAAKKCKHCGSLLEA